MTPGPWKWWTSSNSMRRLSSDATGKDGDVVSAYIASDGVPCVHVKEEDMSVLEAAPELLEALDWALKNLRLGLLDDAEEFSRNYNKACEIRDRAKRSAL